MAEYSPMQTMAEKLDLNAEKTRLEERKKRLSRITLNDGLEEKEIKTPSPTSILTQFDYLFKIVIIGDSVSELKEIKHA